VGAVARSDRHAAGELGAQAPVRVDQPDAGGVPALPHPQRLRRGEVGLPDRLELLAAADQVVEVAGQLQATQPDPYRRAGVALGVDADGDRRNAPGLPAEQAERLADLAADRRTDVPAIRIEEGQDVGAAAQGAAVEAPAAGVRQPEARGRLAVEPVRQRTSAKRTSLLPAQCRRPVAVARIDHGDERDQRHDRHTDPGRSVRGGSPKAWSGRTMRCRRQSSASPCRRVVRRRARRRLRPRTPPACRARPRAPASCARHRRCARRSRRR
jgi:hypothetical protein